MKGQGGVKKFKQMNLRDTEVGEDESGCVGLKDIVVGAWFRARSEGGVNTGVSEYGHRVRWLALLLSSCVTLGKSLDFWNSSICSPGKAGSKSTYPMGL